jgi:hypothetical protein
MTSIKLITNMHEVNSNVVSPTEILIKLHLLIKDIAYHIF